MASNIKVSVIIPVYNAADYIQECLNSVLGQSERSLEVVCINDGSTDRSKDILVEYSKKDSRVRLLNQTNHGAGYSRNQGLKLAQGQYVAFMDPDDLYPDNRVLEDLLTKIDEYGVRACGGCMAQFFNDGRRIEHYAGDNSGYEFAKEQVIDYKDYQFEYGYTRFLYERSLLTGIEFPTYLRFQDPPFFVRALAAAERFCALPRVTYLYRNTPKTIDWKSNRYRKLKDYIIGMTDVAEFAKSHGFDLLLDRLASRLALGGGRFIWCGDYIHAIQDELTRLFEALGEKRVVTIITKRIYFSEKTTAHTVGTALAKVLPQIKDVQNIVKWDDDKSHWMSFKYSRKDDK